MLPADVGGHPFSRSRERPGVFEARFEIPMANKSPGLVFSTICAPVRLSPHNVVFVERFFSSPALLFSIFSHRFFPSF